MTAKTNSLREIEKIARSLNIIYSKKFREYDIKRGQYAYIVFVNENPGLSQLDMVNSLNIDKTTVTKAIKKLVQSDIVFRQKDADDQRMMRVYPTQYGRDIYKNILLEEERLETQLFSSFSEREKFDLDMYLLKISKDIEKEWKNSRSYIVVGETIVGTEANMKAFKKFKRFNPENFYYIYRYKNHSVGFMELKIENEAQYDDVKWSLKDKAILIEDLHIDEKFRGKGFGYELMRSISTFSQVKNIGYIKILVDEKNIPMLKLTNLLEFRFVGELKTDDVINYCFEKRMSL